MTPQARRLLLFGALIVVPFFLIARLFWIGMLSVDKGNDIRYHFSEGVRIAQGVNPYQRIMGANMVNNHKYATLLPPSYLLFALFAKAGCSEYVVFLLYWNVLVYLTHFAIGCFILWRLSRHSWLLGTFGLWFWLFNRWSVQCLMGSYLESFVLVFPLLAVLFVQKRFRAACLLFGIGLGLKHIAVFATPLFAIWGWQRGRWREAALGMTLLVLPSAVASIPFLIANPEAFIRSLLFSGTRWGDNPLWIPLPQLPGPILQLARRVPMVLLCLLVYGATWRGKIQPASAVFLCLSAFVLFNLVHYVQYNLWMIAFLPLAVSEHAWRFAAAEVAGVQP